jgi:dienelactone hydrolase
MTTLQLRASDGNVFPAYLAKPAGTARGGIVVVQEIFGVNSHIRRVTEQYAEQGYLAIAPALFERQEKGVELGYDAHGFEKGIALMMKASTEGVLADVNAAIHAVAHSGRVGMVGYCWGGRVTYLSACKTNIAAGVAYYGGGIAQSRDVPLWREGHAHPALRRRSDPQGLSPGRLPSLPGRSRLQLHRAGRLRSAQRAARVRAIDRVLPQARRLSIGRHHG